MGGKGKENRKRDPHEWGKVETVSLSLSPFLGFLLLYMLSTHHHLQKVSAADLAQTYNVPFEECVAAGAKSVMCSYNAVGKEKNYQKVHRVYYLQHKNNGLAILFVVFL